MEKSCPKYASLAPQSPETRLYCGAGFEAVSAPMLTWICGIDPVSNESCTIWLCSSVSRSN
jgi:hypothetical protein